jgi:hypothetical protein
MVVPESGSGRANAQQPGVLQLPLADLVKNKIISEKPAPVRELDAHG